MKKLVHILLAVFINTSMFMQWQANAQAPEKMSYQAVIRNPSGQLITNTQIGMQISILKGTSEGTAVYVETHTPTTNPNGLVSIEIGTGTTDADFSAIDWANGPYFIQTKADTTGGINYTITGDSQLLSVPYSLYAKTAETVSEGIIEIHNLQDILTQNNSAGNNNITNLADPIDAQDAATKAYVDALLARIEALEASDIYSLILNGFIDSRDSNHYNVVKIGKQLWMAENLRYLPTVVGIGTRSTWIPYYYVYAYDGTNVNDAKATYNYKTYGVLYNWFAAMAGEESSTSNPSGVQGVCPIGWHLPSDIDWMELTNNLYRSSLAGGKLKETGTTHWFAPNTGATNESGFTALPGGNYMASDDYFGAFEGIGISGRWWSATKYDSRVVWMRSISYDTSELERKYFYKQAGYSIRCLRY